MIRRASLVAFGSRSRGSRKEISSSSNIAVLQRTRAGEHEQAAIAMTVLVVRQRRGTAAGRTLLASDEVFGQRERRGCQQHGPGRRELLHPGGEVRGLSELHRALEVGEEHGDPLALTFQRAL